MWKKNVTLKKCTFCVLAVTEFVWNSKWRDYDKSATIAVRVLFYTSNVSHINNTCTACAIKIVADLSWSDSKT